MQVWREQLGQVCPQRRRAGDGGAGRGHQVGDEPPVAVGGHDRVPDRRVGQEGGLDLARFDAVPTDLELLVDPADELEGPVRPAAGPVAGAVVPDAADVHEPFGGEVGPAQVAVGDAGAAEDQFAGHAVGHRRAAEAGDVGAGVADGFPIGGRPVVSAWVSRAAVAMMVASVGP